LNAKPHDTFTCNEVVIYVYTARSLSILPSHILRLLFKTHISVSNHRKLIIPMTDQLAMAKPKTMEELGVALGKGMLGGASQ